MANTTTSPNMGLQVPVVGVDPGPDWANNLNGDFGAIDSHNHATGRGVQINANGINLTADLTLNGNNIVSLRSTQFASQGAVLSAATDVYCVYVTSGNLYYNTTGGTAVQITNGSLVNAGAGSITGLPSGTASASFSTGAFTWLSATSTPATMNVGPLVIGAAVASSKTVTLAPSNTLAANYSLTFPAALPGSTQLVTIDSSGNIATTNTIAPTITGGTITGVTIDNSAIGNITPSSGNFTSLNASGSAGLHGVTATTITASGAVTANNGLTVAGPAELTTGNLSVDTGTLTVHGGGTAASQAVKIAVYSGTIAGSATIQIANPIGISSAVGICGFYSNGTTGGFSAIGHVINGLANPVFGVFFTESTTTGNFTALGNYDASSATYKITLFWQ